MTKIGQLPTSSAGTPVNGQDSRLIATEVVATSGVLVNAVPILSVSESSICSVVRLTDGRIADVVVRALGGVAAQLSAIPAVIIGTQNRNEDLSTSLTIVTYEDI